MHSIFRDGGRSPIIRRNRVRVLVIGFPEVTHRTGPIEDVAIYMKVTLDPDGSVIQ
jgi:hypothetical protein